MNLTNDNYTFTIERIPGNKPVESIHFYYLRYPIENEFTLDTQKTGELDNLMPEYLIKYLYIDNRNSLINGCNFLFFSTSGIAAFGIGMLFSTVIDLGLASTIISVVSFASSGIGITAAGYYGYKYMTRRKELQKIIDTGNGIYLNGNAGYNNINVEIELSF